MKDERFLAADYARVPGITEWHELPDKQVTTLIKLISYLSKK